MSADLAKIAGVVGLVAIAGLVLKGAEQTAVASGMQDARDALFDVSPGCTAITFKGGEAAPDPEQLKLAEQYYFAPFVRRSLELGAVPEADATGVTLLDFLTATVLYDLFPECVQSLPWPPESLLGSGTFGLIWVGMKAYMSGVIERVQAGSAGA